jgi:uncharacterized protein with GYD domain
MPKYLSQVTYTPEGAGGLLKEGGTARVAYLKGLLEKFGGKVEAFYWAFGDTDAYIITDGSNNVDTAAISLAVSATGTMRVKTTVLLTPEEMDAAAKVSVSFRPPGA